MALGSFVEGVFRGMSLKENRLERKRQRGRQETQDGRAAETHDMAKERHEANMRRADQLYRRGSVTATRTAAVMPVWSFMTTTLPSRRPLLTRPRAEVRRCLFLRAGCKALARNCDLMTRR